MIFLLCQLSFLLHNSKKQWKDSHGKMARESLVLRIHLTHVINKQALDSCCGTHQSNVRCRVQHTTTCGIFCTPSCCSKTLQQQSSRSSGYKASLPSIRYLLEQLPTVWHARLQVSCKLHHAMLLACIADLLLSPAVLAVNQSTEQLPTPAAWLTANETCASAPQSRTQPCNTATRCIKQTTSQRWHNASSQCKLKKRSLGLSFHFAVMGSTHGNTLFNHALTS